MVKVHIPSNDAVTAWRVRDALAAHPLLGGATAQISVTAHLQGIILDGWAVDDQTVRLAVRLAKRAAGQRAVQHRLCTHKSLLAQSHERARLSSI